MPCPAVAAHGGFSTAVVMGKRRAQEPENDGSDAERGADDGEAGDVGPSSAASDAARNDPANILRWSPGGMDAWTH